MEKVKVMSTTQKLQRLRYVENELENLSDSIGDVLNEYHWRSIVTAIEKIRELTKAIDNE